MTEQEIIELYEERMAIMQEGNSKDLDWFDTDEINKRLQRAAYFDTKKKVGMMPTSLNPDKKSESKPVVAMRTKAEHIDFGFLIGAIRNNAKALPSNIDGVYERRGSFLFLEFKKPQEKISLGQEILLKALAANDKMQVWIVTGHFEPEKIEFCRAEQLLPNGMMQIVAESMEALKLKINTWHDLVSC